MTFTYQGPLAPGDPRFVGRARELARLQQHCARDVTAYMIVYGGRQNGKTSLLMHLAASLPAETAACLVSFQSIPGASPSEMYSYLGQRIAEQIGDADPAIWDARALVRYLCRTLEAGRVERFVLMLEELGALDEPTRQHLANVLRSMFDQRFTQYRPLTKLQVILAGGVELYSLAATQVSTLHNICDAIYLGDLTLADAASLVQVGMVETGAAPDVMRSAGEAIFSAAGGHPYFTQRLGGLLLDALPGFGGGADEARVAVRQAVDHVIRDDQLLRYLSKGVRELGLGDAVAELLGVAPQFSRQLRDLYQLELLGVARKGADRWEVRNALIEITIRVELGEQNSAPDPATPRAQPSSEEERAVVLTVYTAPRGAGPLSWEHELRDVRRALESYPERFQIEPLVLATPEDLQRALLRHPPAYLHLFGHGTERGIAFHAAGDDAHIVSYAALRVILMETPSLRCVILSSCNSAQQVEQMRLGIPVVAMGGEISQEGARLFAGGFYDALAARSNMSIEQAYRAGISRMLLYDSVETHIPLLIASHHS